MNLATLATRNVLRNKFRTALTILGVAIAIVGFVLLRTIITSWESGVDASSQDRVATRNKISVTLPMPVRFIDELRQTPGVRHATFINLVGLKDLHDEQNFFITLAVDPPTFFTVMDEMPVAPEALARWQADRRGAILGDVLARRLNVQVGSTVTLAGTMYPGDWQFTVDGTYHATRRSVDSSQFLLHWDYFNERLPAASRDRIGMMLTRVERASDAAATARRIDQVFESRGTQTLTMSERATQQSFVGAYAALFTAMDVISMLILGILLMILGNTISMGVRERTNEYGVLRAIGFLPRHIAQWIVLEGVVTGALAGLAGLALAYPIVELGLGRFLEENKGGIFPYFRIDPRIAIGVLAFGALFGAAAALLPAIGAARRPVSDALRHLD